ncbi:hypothetical protein K7432_017275, partial [Basidiobolus ranarum]
MKCLILITSLSTVNGCKVDLYLASARHGVVVPQVNTKYIQNQKGAIDLLFPVTSQFIGSDTLILTENPLKNDRIGSPRKRPSVYGVHQQLVLPSDPN